jgi:hypothetical protein
MVSLAARPRQHGLRMAAGAVAPALAAGSLLAVDACESSAATLDPSAWYVLVNRHRSASPAWPWNRLAASECNAVRTGAQARLDGIGGTAAGSTASR